LAVRIEDGRKRKPETQTPGINAMLNSSSSTGVTSLKPFGPRSLSCNGAMLPALPPLLGVGASRREPPVQISPPTVTVAPDHAVRRHGVQWHGVGAEFVQGTAQHRVDFRFHSPLHLLAAYEQGVRRDGESDVEGVAQSTLRDVARKLTFVPAGHEYREWHNPRTPIGVSYFYFDPAKLEVDSDENLADMLLAPRLFFEDATIWSTAAKLRQAIDAPAGANRLYAEALGVVLFHELVRLNKGVSRVEATVKGGLATWQQRVLTDYIEQHLSEQIPLVALARLTRLSTFHFCRAFKQSFGVPPHRYHTNRRIERAKIMLAERKLSVTEVGLTVGFSETSSFTAVFRKVTGQTPSRYHRALA
jgi:AraC family transcriptional regulator